MDGSPTRLLCPQDSPGKKSGAGCHCLLREGRFLTTGPQGNAGCEFFTAPRKDARYVCSLGWPMTASGQRAIAEVTTPSGRLTSNQVSQSGKRDHSSCRITFQAQRPCVCVCVCVCVKVLEHSPALKPPIETVPPDPKQNFPGAPTLSIRTHDRPLCHQALWPHKTHL